MKKAVTICFAARDDAPIQEGEKGWVSAFTHHLEGAIKKLTGQKFEVKLQSDEDLIANSKISESTHVIAVFSRAFFSSQLLIDYVRNVGEKGDQQLLGLFLENIPSFQQLLPDVQPKVFHMYSFDYLTNNVIRFHHKGSEEYWLKVLDIASQIVYDGNAFLHSKIHKNFKRSIYLAHTGKDLSGERDIIARELMRRGFQLLPDQILPEKHEDLVDHINDALDKSIASIHLIGEDYGNTLDEADISLLDLENQLAAIHADKHALDLDPFKRILWISPLNNHTSVKQKIFIDNLKKDAHSIEHAEVIQSTIEELKFYIRRFLDPHITRTLKKQKSVLIDAAQTRKKQVYIIADDPQNPAAKELAHLLQENKIDSVFSLVSKDILTDRDIHVHNLRSCDAALIFYSTSNYDWVKSRYQDMIKYLSTGRKRPLKAKAVVTDRQNELENLIFEKEMDTFLFEKKLKKEELQALFDKIKSN